eukprot:8897341-Pyramimonas_sp.AAC.1
MFVGFLDAPGHSARCSASGEPPPSDEPLHRHDSVAILAQHAPREAPLPPRGQGRRRPARRFRARSGGRLRPDIRGRLREGARTQTGVATYLDGCLVDWRSVWQQVAAFSTYDAEVTAHAMGEGTEAPIVAALESTQIRC